MSRRDSDGAGAAAFEVLQRHGVWRVNRDGRFFGDYRNKTAAVGAAVAAAILPATRDAAAAVTVIEPAAGE